jgi:deoxyribonuclease-4
VHLYASGYDVADPVGVDALVHQLDAGIGLDRLRALHVNDSAAPLGSNRDRHANIGEGLMGEGLGAFVAHPAFQELSAYLEVPGENKSGPNANEIQKLRDLHARWIARPRARPKRT